MGQTFFYLQVVEEIARLQNYKIERLKDLKIGKSGEMIILLLDLLIYNNFY